jgi:hypothetical protein
MAERYSINIAGVHVQVTSSSLRLSEDLELSYRAFLSPPGSAAVRDISLDIIPLNGKNTLGIPKMYDSGESWSMHKQDDRYYISYNKPSAERPFWIASSNEEFTNITLFCNTDIAGYEQNHGTISNPVRYPLDQIILMYYLARHGGILIHASGIEINEKGYIFAGRSGAGKTTIAEQFIARRYSELLSDDRVIIRETDDTFRVFGTPWPGKGGISQNLNVPLAGIFFLHHSKDNYIEPLGARSVLERILPVASIPWYDPGRMDDILKTCGNLIAGVPAYMLHFRPDTDVVDTFEDFLSGTCT